VAGADGIRVIRKSIPNKIINTGSDNLAAEASSALSIFAANGTRKLILMLPDFLIKNQAAKKRQNASKYIIIYKAALPNSRLRRLRAIYDSSVTAPQQRAILRGKYLFIN
jgi:hypothetical protein